MRARRVGSVALGAAMLAGFSWACSLYLDPPLDPAAPGDGSSNDGPGIEDGGSDARDSAADADAAPVECRADKDCPTVNACATPRCDPKRLRCRYDICPPTGACGFKRCEEGNVCSSTETTLAFKSYTFTVPGTVTCDRPSLCVSLGYPFMYLALETGAVAVDVSDIGSTSPLTIPIEGVDFASATIVASGNVVYFVGRPFLAATPGIRIAWLDAPRHPFVNKLVAASTPSNFPDPSPSEYRALPAPNDGIYLGVVLANGLTQYWAQLTAPVPDTNAFVILSPTAGGGGAPRAPVATSGERALIAAANEYFFFLRRPGQDTVPNGFATVKPAGEITSAAGSSFAQDDEGRIAWTAATLDGTSVKRARLTWLSFDGTSSLDAGVPGIDLAYYDGSVPSTTTTTAPGAIVDPSSAVGLALDLDTGGTNVQLTRRDGGTIARVPNRSTVLPSPPEAVLASFAARGHVYIVEQTPGDPASVSIHVITPACD